MRSPGSHARGLSTCQGLRPRETGSALALTRTPVLPSTTQTVSASRSHFLSRLNTWPTNTPVNASPHTSRYDTHDSGPMGFAIPFIVKDLHLLLLPVSRRTRVENRRLSVQGERFLDRFEAKIHLHGDRNTPRQHPPAEPVQHHGQVDETTRHRNVGDVGGPDLVRPFDRQAAKKIRVNLVFRSWL